MTAASAATATATIAVAHLPLSSPALWLTGLERGLMLAGLSLALGGLAGRGLSRNYKGERPGPLPAPWALRGSLLGLVASLALLLTALAGRGVAAGLAQPPSPGLATDGTAKIALVEIVLFALAAGLLRLRQSGWAAVMLSGVVLAEGIRAHPQGVIPVAGAFVSYCHIFPAVLWAGMLVYAVRAAIAWRKYPAAARGIIKLYSMAAAWLFTIVIATGVISAVVLVPFPYSSLLTTAYGRFLIAKAVVVAVVAGLALAGRAWLGRQQPAGDGPALATKLEVAAVGLVLLITGILTVITPPAKAENSSASGAAAAVSARAAAVSARAAAPVSARAAAVSARAAAVPARAAAAPGPASPARR